MKAGLSRVICTQVAVTTEIYQDLMTYWLKFDYISWGAEPNKLRAMNKHEKCTSNPYLAEWIGSVTLGYIAQHKCKHGAAVN